MAEMSAAITMADDLRSILGDATADKVAKAFGDRSPNFISVEAQDERALRCLSARQRQNQAAVAAVKTAVCMWWIHRVQEGAR